MADERDNSIAFALADSAEPAEGEAIGERYNVEVSFVYTQNVLYLDYSNEAAMAYYDGEWQNSEQATSYPQDYEGYDEYEMLDGAHYEKADDSILPISTAVDVVEPPLQESEWNNDVESNKVYPEENLERTTDQAEVTSLRNLGKDNVHGLLVGCLARMLGRGKSSLLLLRQ